MSFQIDIRNEDIIEEFLHANKSFFIFWPRFQPAIAMTTNFPPDQTVVLKGLRKNITQAEVQRFVKDATPYVQSIHMSQDKYPPRDTHPVLAYLNYQVKLTLKKGRASLIHIRVSPS
jgi:hypothetical protein